MRIFEQTTTLILLALLLLSCSGRNRGAKNYLSEAEKAYRLENYSLAKLKIDSIKIVFPKAFDEIDRGFKLMQEIRLAENLRNITFCDSMLTEHYNRLSEMLSQFDFVRDDRYQEFGEYYPKIYPHNRSLEKNGIRSGVGEKGSLFIESILSGHSISHKKIVVSSNDGSYAETNVVTADGLNYSFKTLDRTYEIVRYGGKDENGVSEYIYTYRDHPITIQFVGNRTIKSILTDANKEGISNSFELSTLLLNIEQLKFEKDKSEVLIRYLNSKKE